MMTSTKSHLIHVLDIRETFLFNVLFLVKSEYTILILVIVKECPIAIVQTGKCCHIHANIFLQSPKNFQHGTGILYQCCIENRHFWLWLKALKPKENLEHTGDNAEQAKITENEAGSTESCVVEELPTKKLQWKVKLMETHAESHWDALLD